MKLFEKTLSEETVFTGRVIRVHVDDVELENGVRAKREVAEHNGGVCVCALTENDEIFFVRQFRYPYKQVLLEVPAGKLEKGEDPFDAVKREQLEETGTTGTGYVYLGDFYPTPGYSSEIIRIWACRASGYVGQRLDEDEFLEVERISVWEAERMVLANEIPDGKTQLAVLKTAALLRAGKL